MNMYHFCSAVEHAFHRFRSKPHPGHFHANRGWSCRAKITPQTMSSTHFRLCNRGSCLPQASSSSQANVAVIEADVTLFTHVSISPIVIVILTNPNVKPV